MTLNKVIPTCGPIVLVYLIVCVFSVSIVYGQQAKLIEMSRHKGFFRAYFSPDSSSVALVGRSKLKIVRIGDGSSVCSLRPERRNGARTEFISAGFSPDGNRLIVNEQIWNDSSGILTQQIVSIEKNTCKLKETLANSPSRNIGKYVSFSPDGERIYAAADFSAGWDLRTRKLIATTSNPDEKYFLKELMLSPDGFFLATYSEAFVPPHKLGLLNLTRLSGSEQVKLNSKEILEFTFTKDSKFLVALESVYRGGSSNETDLVVFQTQNGEVTRRIANIQMSGAFAVSPNGKFAVGGVSEKFIIVSLETGEKVAEAFHYLLTPRDEMKLKGFLTHAEFSPDGSMIATGGEDGTVKLWKFALPN